MSTQIVDEHVEQGARCDLFDRVLVGVDGSEQGLEAVWQASRLLDPDGWLEAFCAVDIREAVMAGFAAGAIAADLGRDAAEALDCAAAISGSRAESRWVKGPPVASILQEARVKRATLVAVGTHERSRLEEILIGGVAGELLHAAPCSVYVARPPAADGLFPRAIVVGRDGSAPSESAVAVGRQLSRRFGATLAFVTGLRGKGVDRERIDELDSVAVDMPPVEALVNASVNADILVVGSRGLHGLGALGSVSERVAHQAICSVLVVRGSG